MTKFTLEQIPYTDLVAIGEASWHQEVCLGLDGRGHPLWTPGKIVHGPRDGDWATTRFGLPEDLSGQDVLEIGACDGLFSFESEQRGAKSVVAFDIDHAESFAIAKRIRKSEVEWVSGDITNADLNPPKHGIVLCFGVLYHLRDPLAALRNLYAAAGEFCLIETAGIPHSQCNIPAWMPVHGHDGDPTNYFYPNYHGLRIAMEHVGFTNVELIYSTDNGIRFTVKANA